MASKADVIVIGAGAAGIFAALRAAELGAKVLLLEKTPRIGTKILVSGGGKCNIAHAGPIESVLKAFRPGEARFIRPACYRLTNEQIVERFTSNGLRVYTRPDGRVFPVDQSSKDVVAILQDQLEAARVDLKLNTPVERILATTGAIVGVRTGTSSKVQIPQTRDRVAFGAKALLHEVMVMSSTAGAAPLSNMEITCARVVLCTGGSSYPNSGTTGDGWPWVVQLGHTVNRVHAALAPIYLDGSFAIGEFSGVALRNCTLRAKAGAREIARWQGDLLFTHQGVSGPCALGISRSISELRDVRTVDLIVDFLPDRSPEQVVQDVLERIQQAPGKLVRTWMAEWVPDRLTEIILSTAGIQISTVGAQCDRKSRNRLAELMKSWKIGTVRHVPLEKGEVVAGGVDLSEVDPQTMRSKLVSGLYLCGEVLDVAGPVGGYNLQASFATGYLAGETAARDAGFGT